MKPPVQAALLGSSAAGILGSSSPGGRGAGAAWRRSNPPFAVADRSCLGAAPSRTAREEEQRAVTGGEEERGAVSEEGGGGGRDVGGGVGGGVAEAMPASGPGRQRPGGRWPPWSRQLGSTNPTHLTKRRS